MMPAGKRCADDAFCASTSGDPEKKGKWIKPKRSLVEAYGVDTPAKEPEYEAKVQRVANAVSMVISKNPYTHILYQVSLDRGRTFFQVASLEEARSLGRTVCPSLFQLKYSMWS